VFWQAIPECIAAGKEEYHWDGEQLQHQGSMRDYQDLLEKTSELDE
jgi:hypothetical protein